MIYKIILIEMALAVTINVVLNFWWSWLIIRQVFRLLFTKTADTNFAGDTIEEENPNEKTAENNLDDKGEKKRSDIELQNQLIDPE